LRFPAAKHYIGMRCIECVRDGDERNQQNEAIRKDADEFDNASIVRRIIKGSVIILKMIYPRI